MNSLKMAMIGGGDGSFIGGVHRMATRLDGRIELVAGSFSSDANRNRNTGMGLNLEDSRIYPTYQALFEREAGLSRQDRIDFVTIVTPNHLHADPAMLALQAGFPVMLDKPLTNSLKSAQALYKIWKKHSLPFGISYTYAGYPMLMQARYMVQNGVLGKIRKVYVEYLQGWLSSPIEHEGQKQAAWRTDPTKSGRAGALGDIGSHAFHLAEFVSSCRVSGLDAFLERKIARRKLDDDAMVWLQFQGGATGSLLVSQVATGAENNITIKVVGERGTMQWQHEHANRLVFYSEDGIRKEYRSGVNYHEHIADEVSQFCRTPGGHPEGYIEAFANQYFMFVEQVCLWKAGHQNWNTSFPYLPTLYDGLRGMYFIDTSVDQSTNSSKWAELVVHEDD